MLSTTNYFWKPTLLYTLGQFCVPTCDHRYQITWDMHYSKTAWHFGVSKTLVILQKYFYWPSLKTDVNRYIRSCVVCAISKPPNQWKGLYMPLSVPSRPWEYISMECMLGYPTTKHQHDTILVVVGRFSKMVILIPCKKTTTAQLFFQHVWKQCGLLTTTNSDRDAKY